MENNRILQGVLGLLLGYNVVFFAAHIRGEARALAKVLSEVQSLLNIFELIAVMVLFVDLVLRFDHIAKNWQVPRVAAVGLCLTGMLFKWFILYLHLSYLVD